MESADKNAEHLEMVAVKTGNDTYVAVDIDWFVSQIHCHCQGQFMSCLPIILNCLHSVVACQIRHLDEPCSPSLAVIHSSTYSINNNGGKLL